MKNNLMKSLILTLALVFAAFFSANETFAQVEMVYVTKSGDKFHKKDCHHLKGNTNLTSMELGKAKTGKYVACKGCYDLTKTTPVNKTKTTPVKTTPVDKTKTTPVKTTPVEKTKTGK